MKKKTWRALWEATKEPIRLLVLAVLPFLVVHVRELPYEWAVGATVLLRWLDKVLFEIGKATKDKKLAGGLTRF